MYNNKTWRSAADLFILNSLKALPIAPVLAIDSAISCHACHRQYPLQGTWKGSVVALDPGLVVHNRARDSLFVGLSVVL